MAPIRELSFYLILFLSVHRGSCSNCTAGQLTLVGYTPPCVEVCPKGTYQINSTHCQPCPAGSAQSQEGQTNCTECPAGWMARDAGSTFCSRCPPGTYSTHPGTVNCADCPVGYYANTTSLTACYPCSPGSFQRYTGMEECELCGRGEYQPDFHQTYCMWCRTYKTEEGAATCPNCTPGQQVVNDKCEDCPRGYYKPYSEPPTEHITMYYNSEYYSSDNSSSCIPCEAGSAQNSTGSTFCVPCTSGFFQDLTGQDECKVCEEGFTTLTPAATSCQALCGLGRYSDTGVEPCSTCPDGTTTTSLGSTKCSPEEEDDDKEKDDDKDKEKDDDKDKNDGKDKEKDDNKDKDKDDGKDDDSSGQGILDIFTNKTLLFAVAGASAILSLLTCSICCIVLCKRKLKGRKRRVIHVAEMSTTGQSRIFLSVHIDPEKLENLEMDRSF